MRKFLPASVLATLLATIGSAKAGWLPARCETRVNDTQPKLLACIRTPDLWRILTAFQRIADANPGIAGHANRDTGTSGYRQSVRFVATTLRAAGYKVTIQPYYLPHFVLDGANLQGTTMQSQPGRDWFVARLSGSGTAAGRITQPQTDQTGCEAGAFGTVAKGNIVLLRRGPCAPDLAVRHAVEAGARAVIFQNDWQNRFSGGKWRHDGRAFPLNLTRLAGVPVIGFISTADGRRLVGQTVTLNVRAHVHPVEDFNVIADSRYGNPNRVVVIEGHLDAIYGPGILDNGSGSATILDTALALQRTPTPNHLRFIWFGGEELGLFGSAYYTRHLNDASLKKLMFDLDADVTATPNFDILVADPRFASNRKEFPPNVVPQSKPGTADFLAFFRARGIPAAPAWFGNDGTDSNSFSLVGVPNTGILTNQDCCKTKAEVAIWGGYRGDYDGVIPGFNQPCVDTPGRWCDTLANTDRAVFWPVSQSVASVTLSLAQDMTLGRSPPPADAATPFEK